MDLLTDDKLQIMVQRINERITHTQDGCWQWTGNYCYEQPRILINGTSYSPIRHLWQQANPDLKAPRTFEHLCPLKHQCVNPDHKLPPEPKKPTPKRPRFQRHGPHCPGPDQVVVERIIQAGTANIIPAGDVICDCERAYIVAYVPRADAILKINGETRQRLSQLATQLDIT